LKKFTQILNLEWAVAPRIFLILVAIAVLINEGAAQISDSLYNALPQQLRPANKKKLTGSEKRQILHGGGAFNQANYEPDLSLLATSLLQEANTSKDSATIILNNVAAAEYFLGRNMEQSVACCRNPLSAAGNSSTYLSTLAAIQLKIGTAYIYQDRHDSAIVFLQASQNKARQAKDSLFLIDTYNTFNVLYARLQLYEKAIQYGNAGIQLYSQKDKWSLNYTKATLTNSISYALLYNQTKNKRFADSAYGLIYQAMHENRTDAAGWYGTCYFFLGYLAYVEKDYQKAVNMLDSSILPVYNQSSLYFSNYDFGRFLFKGVSLIKLGRYKEGKQIIDQVNIPAKRYPALQLKSEALYEYAMKNGDWQTAFDEYRKYVAYSDSLDILGQKGRVFEAEQKYAVAEKQAAIVRLENDNLLKERERKQFANIALAVALGLAVTIIVIILMIAAYKRSQSRRIIERQQLANDLHKMEMEMALSHEQEKAEREAAMIAQRKSISKNLHDELSGSIAALRYFVADMKRAADTHESRQVLEEIEEETKNVYQQAREFMHGLHNNSKVSQYNVADFLENLSERFGAGSNLEIVTEVDRESITRHFSQLQHAEMYRVVREAVTNSMKHSGANRMTIRLNFKDGLFHFDIADNGKGLSAGNAAGLGFASLQERVAALKGELQVESSVKGLRLWGSFPAN
jgi:signal transduction histidine kinase